MSRYLLRIPPAIRGRKVASVEAAQALYCKIRDESGEGASAFGEGRVLRGETIVARISYNGRVWDAKGRPVAADEVCGLDADLLHGRDP